MANYKKKRKKLIRSKSVSSSNVNRYETIGFNENKIKPAKRKMAKNKRSTNTYFAIAAICVIICLAYSITIILHPVGVFEYLKSIYTSIGYGEGYNIDIDGGKPSYTVSSDNKYFLITDGSVNCYNVNGKEIFQNSHNYSQPVVKISDTRYLLYNQGESELSINTFSNKLYTHTFSSGIINAAISDSGAFAVATKSEGYESAVAVYDKNNKKIYEWFSSEETVNSLALSPNGKTLAVSTIKVENGKFITGVYVLEFNSANAIMKRSYTDSVVYQLMAISNSSFCAVFSNSVEFLNYKRDAVVSHQSEYSVSIVKYINNRVIALRTVAANQDESLIEVYKPNGKLVSSFKVNSCVNDFSYKSGKVYLLGMSEIYKYSLKGQLMSYTQAGYDALFIEAISQNNVACVRNSTIDKYSLVKMEE